MMENLYVMIVYQMERETESITHPGNGSVLQNQITREQLEIIMTYA